MHGPKNKTLLINLMIMFNFGFAMSNTLHKIGASKYRYSKDSEKFYLCS